MGVAVSAAGLSGRSDPDLVAAVRAGDDSAYEELYRRYRPRVTAFAQGIVGERGRAEEVTQEAFISAWQALGASDAEITFKAWIYAIARNASLNVRRRQASFEEISITADEPPLRPGDHLRLVSGAATPDDALAAKESLEHLGGAFDELTDNHFHILVMRELEGLSYGDIARRMGISPGAVQVMLLRARRRLRAHYAEVASGARCTSASAALDRMAERTESRRDRRMVTSHLVRCARCRRHARELGVSVQAAQTIRARVAAVLGVPWLVRPGRGSSAGGYHGEAIRQASQQWMPVAAGPGAESVTPLVKTAAIAVVGLLLGGGVVVQHESPSSAGAPAVDAAGPPASARGADRDDRPAALARGGAGRDVRAAIGGSRTEPRSEPARHGAAPAPSHPSRSTRGTAPARPRHGGTGGGTRSGTTLPLPPAPAVPESGVRPPGDTRGRPPPTVPVPSLSAVDEAVTRVGREGGGLAGH